MASSTQKDREQVLNKVLARFAETVALKSDTFDAAIEKQFTWLREILPEAMESIHSNNPKSVLPPTPSSQKLREEAVPSTPFMSTNGRSYNPIVATPSFTVASTPLMSSRVRSASESEVQATPLRRSARLGDPEKTASSAFKAPLPPSSAVAASARKTRAQIAAVNNSGVFATPNASFSTSFMSESGETEQPGTAKRRRRKEHVVGARQSKRLKEKQSSSNSSSASSSRSTSPASSRRSSRDSMSENVKIDKEEELRKQINCVVEEFEQQKALKDLERKQKEEEEQERKQKEAEETEARIREEETRRRKEEEENRKKEAKEQERKRLEQSKLQFEQEKKRLEEEKLRLEEQERKQLEEENKRRSEEKRLREQIEEERRKVEEERKRKDAEKRQAEEERKAKEEERKRIEAQKREEERKRQEELLRQQEELRIQEEQRRKEEEDRKREEQEKKRREAEERERREAEEKIRREAEERERREAEELRRREAEEAEARRLQEEKEKEDERKRQQAAEELSLDDLIEEYAKPIKRASRDHPGYSLDQLMETEGQKSEQLDVEDLIDEELAEEDLVEQMPDDNSRLSDQSAISAMSRESMMSTMSYTTASTATSPVSSKAKGLDIPKSSSPLLHDPRKNRAQPSKSKMPSEADKRRQRAAENRAKIQQVIQQKEREKKEKKETAAKRAQETQAERKQREIEELRKKNEDKKRKKEEVEQNFSEQVKRKKEKLEEKDKVEVKAAPKPKVEAKAVPKEGEVKRKKDAEPEEERKAKTQKVQAEAAPTKMDVEPKVEEQPKSAVSSLVSYVTSFFSGAKKEDKENATPEVTRKAVEPKSQNPMFSPTKHSLAQILQTQAPSVANVPAPSKPATAEKQLMPPPITSPVRVAGASKMKSPTKVVLASPKNKSAVLSPAKSQQLSHNERIVERLKQFAGTLRGCSGGLFVMNTVTREYLDKLHEVMTVEEYYFLQARLFKVGWKKQQTGKDPKESEGYGLDFNRDLIVKNLYDFAQEFAVPSSASEPDSYEISDYVSSSSDDDSEDDNARAKKHVPVWAREPQLHTSLVMQQYTDPDKIFPSVFSCDLEDIFQPDQRPDMDSTQKKRYKKRLGQRSSSANWDMDSFSVDDKLRYQNKFGFHL
eukprot:TRINITY_DN1390_c0_g1_i1.p1 TRINITY_DN1390_c0_g1~~TRINITY_DN1390_c0_g1_i1.p1  ORF type:complete len:1130 (+),score=487.23 TRINITY_DN1390_c0_g1_i1:150-3539(+)